MKFLSKCTASFTGFLACVCMCSRTEDDLGDNNGRFFRHSLMIQQVLHTIITQSHPYKAGQTQHILKKQDSNLKETVLYRGTVALLSILPHNQMYIIVNSLLMNCPSFCLKSNLIYSKKSYFSWENSNIYFWEVII